MNGHKVGDTLKRILAACFIVCLSHVVLAQQEPPDIEFTVDRFVVEGDNPLDTAVTTAALAPFRGNYQGLDGLLAAGDALERELQLQGHTFHRVVLPPQTLDAGTVVLRVVQFTLAEVNISGNEHFPDANVQRSLRDLRRGEVPNTRRLSRVLSVANQHPSKHLRLNFAQSETEVDALDANISVQDRRPWQLFAAFNNIGTDESGNTRLSLAVCRT